jgi:hypothetical protein
MYATGRADPRADHRLWIVSPAFDLLFFANLWWLVAFLPFFVSAERQSTAIDFWQVYFLTAPHRWLTLLLVSTDPDRRQHRTWLFLVLAIAAALIVPGMYTMTGAFTCLALVDYVWNAWHFASQHAGITRIYARKAGGGRPRLETVLIRTFVTYTCLRLAGWTTGWTSDVPQAAAIISIVDLAILALPAWLLALDGLRRPADRSGKLTYLASITFMYGSLLLAVREGNHRLVLALTVASAAYHAVEYLAIVTFYAWRRREHGSDSPFRTMAGHWLEVLAAFAVCVGIIGEYAEREWQQLWMGLNLWAAFLHYAYDGMIWKLRRPATAETLGVQLSTEHHGG